MTNTKGLKPSLKIISPSVDLELFKPLISDNREHLGGSAVIRIGFFARLATEKNPGLFLLAAQILLEQYPFCRFVVIGDGELRASLEELAGRLKISRATQFMGMLSGTELIQTLGMFLFFFKSK